MHIWGQIALHPMTFPIAGEIAHCFVLVGRFTLVMYGAVLQPTVEEFIFIVRHLD